MGSAKLLEAQPITMAENDKTTFKSLLKKPLQAIFRKKKREPANQRAPLTNHSEATLKLANHKVPDVEQLQQNLEKLCLEKKNNEDDEFQQFTIKVIDEDKSRLNSNCSEDSGYADDRSDPDLVEGLKGLVLDDKKKKPVKVYVSRAPIRVRDERSGAAGQPYQQILNRQTFTGSQVIITKDDQITTPFGDSRQNYSQDGVLQLALTELQNNVNNFPINPQEGQIYWLTAQEFLEESLKREAQIDENILSDFKEICPVTNAPLFTEFNTNTEQLNPIEEFENADKNLDFNDITLDDFQELPVPLFLTPPRSNETQMSPSSFNSPSPAYLYSSSQNISSVSSECLLSPSRSSPNLSRHDEYEKYQDITPLDEIPSCVIDSEKKYKKKSLSMKNFKQIQAELQAGFAKKDCCQPKKDSKEYFRGFFEKLTQVERKDVCMKVASLDLNTAYGVLQHILLSLSKSSDQEVLQYALFGLICERILAEKPSMYLGPCGLNLLKASALRCPSRPELTRYIVQCVRLVLSTAEVKDSPVFTEVDINGDNLLSACCARGDECADVLAALLEPAPGAGPAGAGPAGAGPAGAGAAGPALFDVHHNNFEGFSALHVAVRRRGLHAAHVLLAHGGADLARGDMKSGDTALHLAVSSARSSLRLVLTLFAGEERAAWRRLAHANNRSSVTPLELARLASKSTSRTEYPSEILNFLKKCR